MTTNKVEYEETEEAIVNIALDIDLNPLYKAIETSGDLNDNDKMFRVLSMVADAKQLLEDELDKILKLEDLTKRTINARAKALYGTEWSVIAGHGYKINRTLTGSVYSVDDAIKTEDLPSELLKVKIELNSKAVDKYIKENSELPDGVAYNPVRGESIRIKLTSE